jgi:multimeric flavodoxin WrbA
MKVTAFVGSARKKHSYRAAERFLKNLETYGNIEWEIVRLSDYNLKVCRGCKLCMDKGEELCPLKDDRDLLLEKMDQSDGVVFVTPNYSFQVSGFMKIFLDRLAFICHRPRFFGKTFTCIVAEGIYGGNNILKYLNFLGAPLGFDIVKGSCITTLEPMTDKAAKKINKTINTHSRKFYSQLIKKENSKPNLFEFIMFRIFRTRIKYMLNSKFRDYAFYRNQGWFETDFYFPVKFGFFRKILGRICDRITTQTLKNKVSGVLTI